MFELLESIRRGLTDGVRRARKERVTFVAAGLSYYVFLSAIPILVFSLAAVHSVAGAGAEQEVRAVLGWWLPARLGDMVTELAETVGERTEVTVTGALVLAWSVFRFVRGVEDAFDMVYDFENGKSLRETVTDAVVVVLVVSVGVAVVIAVTVAGQLLALPRPQITGSIVLTLTLVLVFQPLYYVVPSGDVDLRAVIPGGLLAGAVWTVLHAAFSTYLTHASSNEVYGVFGGVVVALMWIYLGALALLLGAVANAVLASERSSSPG